MQTLILKIFVRKTVWNFIFKKDFNLSLRMSMSKSNILIVIIRGHLTFGYKCLIFIKIFEN